MTFHSINNIGRVRSYSTPLVGTIEKEERAFSKGRRASYSEGLNLITGSNNLRRSRVIDLSSSPDSAISPDDSGGVSPRTSGDSSARATPLSERVAPASFGAGPSRGEVLAKNLSVWCEEQLGKEEDRIKELLKCELLKCWCLNRFKRPFEEIWALGDPQREEVCEVLESWCRVRTEIIPTIIKEYQDGYRMISSYRIKKFSRFPCVQVAEEILKCFSSRNKDFNLSLREISVLPTPAISFLPQLQSLDLSHNNLEGLPVDFQLPNLKVLILAFNNLRFLLPGDLSGVPNLEELDLSHTNLQFLPADLYQLPLRVLNLAHNSLRSLPEDDFPCYDLKARPKIFPTKFFLLGPYLEKLNLSDNELPRISEAISCCKKLTSLNVSCNKLKSFPFLEVVKLPFLEKLKISGNHLAALSPERFQKIVSILQARRQNGIPLTILASSDQQDMQNLIHHSRMNPRSKMTRFKEKVRRAFWPNRAQPAGPPRMMNPRSRMTRLIERLRAAFWPNRAQPAGPRMGGSLHPTLTPKGHFGRVSLYERNARKRNMTGRGCNHSTKVHSETVS